jgi:hypothetical protein
MNNLENNFVPYQIALDMKSIGFDEPCFAIYYNPLKELVIGGTINPYTKEIRTLAPLYQQAFDFFRDKYNLHAEPYTTDMGAIEYCFQIRDLYSEKYVYDNFVGAGSSYAGTFSTPEEAELECLVKLIEIVKNK